MILLPHTGELHTRGFKLCIYEKNLLHAVHMYSYAVRIYVFCTPYAVLRILIRMDPHGFCLLDSHPESAFQMRIPDAEADPG
jgi:hypothetical protein